jgi:hypothetical protein
LDSAIENGIVFTPEPGRPWLLKARVGCQYVVAVICRDLPLERRYYRWLLFAPSDSKRWERFIRRLRIENEEKLLELAQKLRPKEYNMVKVNAAELWEIARQEGVLTPEVEAYYTQQRKEAVEILINDLEGRDPWQTAQSFDDMTDQQLGIVLDSLDELAFAAFLHYIKPQRIERVRKVAKPDKQALLQILLGKQQGQAQS